MLSKGAYMPDGTSQFKTVDMKTMPKHFDAAEAETRWNNVWQKTGTYRYDPDQTRENTFVVDTPPPTVSGSLHIGHVLSYTHTDITVRYQRMQGKNIYYPMGWDDNGLPTERRVQNYFHIQCEPTQPYDPALKVEPATAKKRKERPVPVSRKNFIEICHQLTLEDEKTFKDLWQRAGLSVDWNEQYATIDTVSQHIAQLSFLDLYEKGHIYSSELPAMWDVDFRTAVAQAELEDREVQGAYYHIAFGIEDEDSSFTIATTRPELIVACVGVTAHPEDSRYRHLFGKRAITPLYHIPVPIFPSEIADPEKGTGILMVCTFGDSSDVDWWRGQKLELRQVLDRSGRMMPVDFESSIWPSNKPDMARQFYGQIEGKSIKAAQAAVVEQLTDPAASAVSEKSPSGTGAPLQRDAERIVHPVKYFEKGTRPIEFIPTRQWFVRLLDKKEMLIRKGKAIQWHPDYMGLRFENWTENLAFDWCISRQRYFGPSLPVWYPLDADLQPRYDAAIVAQPEQLPVDPMIHVPKGYDETQRNTPGGFTGEQDVFDTWFTSSMTPQIASKWILDIDRHGKLFPMDLRPQAHDIIRTWAFYTIAKAALHEDKIPWKHAAISGFVVDPDRKKMSKSKGNVVTPMEFLEKYTADGVRYWSGQANLGTDTNFDEKVMKVGRRLVTKIFNAGKFVLSQSGEVAPISEELDKSFVARLRKLAVNATRNFENYESAKVIAETEDFFWHSFTDTYIELTKNRAKGEGNPTPSAAAQNSAVVTLRLGLKILLKLFAPFLPFITEEVWSWTFAKETEIESIHVAPWPSLSDFIGFDLPANEKSFDVAVAALGAIHKQKTLSSMSAGAQVSELEIEANKDTLAVLRKVERDVMDGARVESYSLAENDALTDGEFIITKIEFAARE